MRTCVWLLASTATASTCLAQAPTPQVQASVPVFVEERGAVRVQIDNLSDTAITAWQVRIRVRYVDGVERRYGRSREGYATFEGLSEEDGRVIPPRGTVETWFPLPRATTVPVLTLEAEMGWAIFADNTSVGDPAGIEEAFTLRTLERAAWSEVREAMKAAAEAGDRVEGLRAAGLLLTQGDATHAIVRNMRRNIDRVLEQSPGTADAFVTFWSGLAARHMQALATHSRPDVPGAR